VQYHAVDDTSFGATALTPAAAGNANATVDAVFFEEMWAARVPTTSAATMTAQIKRRLARSLKDLLTAALSGSLIWITHLADSSGRGPGEPTTV
jgi:hypothetical protein